MNELYFRGLKSLVLPAPNNKSYELLLNKLYSEDFTPIIRRDDNRADDGLFLREMYGAVDDRPCTLLEMLIALAGRFDGNVGFDPDEAYSNFWILMDNVGLSWYSDESYSEREVVGMLGILEARTYDYNGRGGLFPLKHPKTDQRKTEIWDQLQAWEIENYGV